ncbi:ribosome biogenesis GTP-binding protein YihA/YsxC [uncultured Desulfovibrio sp.]|uniref:ribosome biogenesis GTP-binding protein YihA/YsxC n=1 Tax=uncultured Desulfovibrio sp. TaxID=167968 RepID=UPI002608DFC1|nr:ribosome biogenesis GTP-binding protein YihA/YsxC [uncultured Desulfovibrio sp.]
MPVSLVLETTAYTLDQLPTRHETQIALAGRSNVGKSSLINALAGRRKLAKVSATPGKTRSVNFYRVEPHGFYLVDLPGYGYARAGHAEREKWARLLERYLTECPGLRALALLLDSRLPPQQLDKNLAAFARGHDLPLLPILTKADKCNQRERAARQKDWQDLLGVRPVVTSSSNRLGMDTLWRALMEIAGADENEADGVDAAARMPQGNGAG